jgi:prolyl-tRNA synthetase
MRFSQFLISTQKETPNDAVLPSHIYLIRGGFISPVSSGLYNFLPLGKKVLSQIENIVREELNNSNAQEVDLSFVTPADLWEESGRINKFGKELLRFKDRKENLFVLGPTHEEMMVNLVRNTVKSYKQLPLNLYQIKTKFRDEARPRFGLMRGREFLMKDGYSFHDSHEDMVREFENMEKTYTRILERLGLDFRVVEADSGAIGGSGSKEFMVLADSGEDTLAVCNSCEYGANIETAKRQKLKVSGKDLIEIEMKNTKFSTPNMTSIDELSEFFHVNKYFLVKAVVKKAIYEDHEKLAVFFLRGLDELEETKAINTLENALDLVDATEEDLSKHNLVAGFIGVHNLPDEVLNNENIKIICDIELENAKTMITGSNEKDFHTIGIDFSELETKFIFKDIATVQEGNLCPVCGSKISHKKGIEVGHIFQLGTNYSEKLNANFLDNNGKSQPYVMGTYGIGVSRLVAGIVEQNHDEKGMIWNKAVNPFYINILVSNIKNKEQLEFSEYVYTELKKKNLSVIIDDRKERFGFKMKDSELIGFPFTVIIGKKLEPSDESPNGQVELFNRATFEKISIDKDKILDYILENL